MLGATLGLPVDGICTLDVIAASAAEAAGGREFLVATDARRKELYWASYSAFGQRVTGPEVSPAADLPAGLPVAGEGARLYPELVEQALDRPGTRPRPGWPRWPPSGSRPGRPRRRPQPLYLRRPDAREPGQRKRVTP